MKIFVFEPHPDDLLFGPGPILIDLIKEGHDIHVITVTDGRACYRIYNDIEMEEDAVAEMRISEAKEAIKFLKIPSSNHHLLSFYDADGQKYVKDAIKKVKPLIKDADILFLPSNNNSHEDHQATHDIAVGAAQELGLNVEFWIYFIPTYGRFKADSEYKQFEFEIDDSLRETLLEWLEIYQSQKKTRLTWKFFIRYLKFLKTTKYGKYKLEDKGKYYNF